MGIGHVEVDVVVHDAERVKKQAMTCEGHRQPEADGFVDVVSRRQQEAALGAAKGDAIARAWIHKVRTGHGCSRG